MAAGSNFPASLLDSPRTLADPDTLLLGCYPMEALHHAHSPWGDRNLMVDQTDDHTPQGSLSFGLILVRNRTVRIDWTRPVDRNLGVLLSAWSSLDFSGSCSGPAGRNPAVEGVGNGWVHRHDGLWNRSIVQESHEGPDWAGGPSLSWGRLKLQKIVTSRWVGYIKQGLDKRLQKTAYVATLINYTWSTIEWLDCRKYIHVVSTTFYCITQLLFMTFLCLIILDLTQLSKSICSSPVKDANYILKMF